MRATHWLIGCALCIAGIGSATATSLDTQDLDSSPHATADSASTHGGNASGGDALGLSRDCPSASNSDNSGNSSSNGNDHSGGASSAPTQTRRLHLGWQSLLPGSIQ
ncbi:hypothetical protein EAH75_08920 [Rhodanobacter glycinis]|uniref:Secreted protein n=1 Tax=Rhodanobacter glycinis TaxID=582702 RepID=A0A502CH66_9GAMM|nr:hypothetical protein [Rhodanobacter glycinis]TPG11071.1 hypothetical protein EAH88_00490 [Rhodanobacter glycinis]TPG48559.1 hypothetical protein EAH75_08920 [Rhodanobacter glycinis]